MGRLRTLVGLKGPQNKDGLPPKARFSIWYLVIAILAFSYMQQYFFSGKVETIPYSQFKQHVVDGNLVKLTIGPESISGTVKGEPVQKFVTVRVDDPGLVKELDENKINYSGYFESKLLSMILSWVVPIAVFFLIWRFAMKRMGPGMGVMSSKPKRRSVSPTWPASMRPRKSSRRWSSF